jgi:D-glycero-D-manno-heptose 1,7-bisphosphate phosphatase
VRQSPGAPGIFVDRDGVINRRRADDYVLNWSQFEFLPGIRAALGQLASLQLPMIIISNQSAVGRGYLETEDLEYLTKKMCDTLSQDGAHISAVYYCTHRPDQHCSCRKPQPQLLLEAAVDYQLDLARSVFIGDSDADVQAAESAGCQPVLFGPGLTTCSDSADWISGVPVALKAQDLYPLVAPMLLLTPS